MAVLTTKEPPGITIDVDLLTAFEYGLDPQSPETNPIPSRVLGYGEISTVFEIQTEAFAGLALKRMSIFESEAELDAYLLIYDEYHELLAEEIGIQLPRHGYVAIKSQDDRPIFYIIQQKVEGHAIGNTALALLDEADAQAAFKEVLAALGRVLAFNEAQDRYQVALDGQISNWALSQLAEDQPQWLPGTTLLYIDTSTPIYRINGQDQLDPELFLRAAPSFLRWVLRRFYLEDVVTRYYDMRQVVVDLLGNLYKERLAALVPAFITMTNGFFQDNFPEAAFAPITEAEVEAYYKEDKSIWSLYLSMRRLDRFMHTKVLRGQYPYILPGKVAR